eukprot:Tbor_TRINITY_DN6001_c5_g4::TRINITY_DN6001_c5_g4_i1::g.11306::m.11306/K03032/PSMD1, RPN2; 26S proteasome regulatory subunit N2
MTLSSSQGLLALLRESDPVILQFALNRLNEIVDKFWFEICDDLSIFEELNESMNLQQETREIAALVAAKVFFHLGEYTDSVRYALAAGDQFKSDDHTQFSDTILSRIIDIYVDARMKEEAENEQASLNHAIDEGVTSCGFGVVSNDSGVAVSPIKGEAAVIDPRLERLFDSIADLWQAESVLSVSVKDLVGFFIRARRIDLLEKVLTRQCAATKSSDILTFCLKMANRHVRDISFRRSILKLLARMYTEGLDHVDYIALCECLIFLQDDEKVATLLRSLIESENKNKLMVYQLGFDLSENCNQDFLKKVSDRLTRVVQPPAATATVSDSTVEEVATIPAPTTVPIDESLQRIMEGEMTTSLYLKFLYARCAADIHILNHMKKGLDPRNSVTHNATVIANAFMYSGTTIDGFLRDNLEWLGKSTNWAKFTTTASIGAIHKGHSEEAMNILQPYLPTLNNVGLLPFQESGSLYALGLIHSSSSISHRGPAVEYLRDALRNYGSNEIMVHGASLGLGLAAMGLNDEDIFDSLFACVSGYDAVAGEGAAVAIGLSMLGCGDVRLIDMMLKYACETDQKEKTIRGLSMGIALMLMGRENDADPIINIMLENSDPWVRLGGCFSIGLAYVGTNSTHAIELLLNSAVRDTSNDVRRNAVTMIGLVSFKNLSQCLDMTKVLTDSYNSHIRYGVAMALAIAACGTGDKKVVDILWGLKDDTVDFVRQGTAIALAMVFMQVSEVDEPRVKEFRALLKKKIADRREGTCTKFGYILATGLIDGGGRNCTMALHKGGHTMNQAVVGLFLFVQHWFWFPYTLMVTMAFQPTCIIGLNESLVMPNYSFKSNSPPSRFVPPKSILIEKKEAKALGTTKAVLSTTKKELSRQQKKKGAAVVSPTGAGCSGDFPKGPEVDDAAKKEEESEPKDEVLTNPARVTMAQLDVLSHDVDSRYRPLKPKPFGICLLVDTKPSEEADLVAAIDPKDRNDEVPPPEPFAWE